MKTNTTHVVVRCKFKDMLVVPALNKKIVSVLVDLVKRLHVTTAIL